MFLLKTDSGYPRDAEVALFTLANPGSSLRVNTHGSAPPDSALARSGGPSEDRRLGMVSTREKGAWLGRAGCGYYRPNLITGLSGLPILFLFSRENLRQSEA